MWSPIVRTSSPGSADPAPRLASPLVGVDDEAGKGLGVEVRRLLRHHVTIRRDCGDLGDRRGIEQEDGVGTVTSAIDPIDGLGYGLGVRKTPGCDRRRTQATQPSQGDLQKHYVEVMQRGPAFALGRGESVAAGGEQGTTLSRPQSEAALAARYVRRRESGLQLGPTSDGLNVEEPLGVRKKIVHAFLAQRPNDAVGRQDGQLLLCHFEEEHHHVLGSRIAFTRLVGSPLVAVAQRGLVAVMTVGDGDRLLGGTLEKQLRKTGVRPILGRSPEAVSDAVVIGNVHIRSAGGNCRQGLHRPTARIGVDAYNRARVHVGGHQKFVTVFLRRGEGSLVRQNAAARPEILQSQESEEASLRSDLERARNPIGLLVDVDAGMGVPAKGAVDTPGLEQTSGAPVSIVKLVASLDLGQIQSHGIGRVASQQGLMQLRSDYVVWRAGDATQVPNLVGVEPKRAKSTNLWHRGSLAADLTTSTAPRATASPRAAHVHQDQT